jgi:hypothetical protein
MSKTPEAIPANEREVQFKKYKAVHEWALGTLVQRTLSPESAIDFVNDTSATGVEQVRLRLADTKFALTTFIKVYAQDDASLRRRSEQLLESVTETERHVQETKTYWASAKS